MDKDTAISKYSEKYNGKTGIAPMRPMVDAVRENKHGIDNPVIDLNIRKYVLPIQQQIASLPILTSAVVNEGEVLTYDDEIVYII